MSGSPAAAGPPPPYATSSTSQRQQQRHQEHQPLRQQRHYERGHIPRPPPPPPFSPVGSPAAAAAAERHVPVWGVNYFCRSVTTAATAAAEEAAAATAAAAGGGGKQCGASAATIAVLLQALLSEESLSTDPFLAAAIIPGEWLLPLPVLLRHPAVRCSGATRETLLQAVAATPDISLVHRQPRQQQQQQQQGDEPASGVAADAPPGETEQQQQQIASEGDSRSSTSGPAAPDAAAAATAAVEGPSPHSNGAAPDGGGDVSPYTATTSATPSTSSSGSGSSCGEGTLEFVSLLLLIERARNTLVLRDVAANTTAEDIFAIVSKAPILQHQQQEEAADGGQEEQQQCCNIRKDVNDTWFVSLRDADKTQDVALWLRGQKLKGVPVKVGIKASHALHRVISAQATAAAATAAAAAPRFYAPPPVALVMGAPPGIYGGGPLDSHDFPGPPQPQRQQRRPWRAQKGGSRGPRGGPGFSSPRGYPMVGGPQGPPGAPQGGGQDGGGYTRHPLQHPMPGYPQEGDPFPFMWGFPPHSPLQQQPQQLMGCWWAPPPHPQPPAAGAPGAAGSYKGVAPAGVATVPAVAGAAATTPAIPEGEASRRGQQQAPPQMQLYYTPPSLGGPQGFGPLTYGGAARPQQQVLRGRGGYAGRGRGGRWWAPGRGAGPHAGPRSNHQSAGMSRGGGRRRGQGGPWFDRGPVGDNHEQQQGLGVFNRAAAAAESGSSSSNSSSSDAAASARRSPPAAASSPATAGGTGRPLDAWRNGGLQHHPPLEASDFPPLGAATSAKAPKPQTQRKPATVHRTVEAGDQDSGQVIVGSRPNGEENGSA